MIFFNLSSEIQAFCLKCNLKKVSDQMKLFVFSLFFSEIYIIMHTSLTNSFCMCLLGRIDQFPTKWVIHPFYTCM